MIFCSGCWLGEAIHEMHFRSDRPLAPRRGGIDLLNDVSGAAGQVGFLHHFLPALGMNDHFHLRIFRPRLIHVLRAEQLMHRALALPKNEIRLRSGVTDRCRRNLRVGSQTTMESSG